MAKRAALMLNLGSPDSTSVPDVRKYLDEFLMDPRVIDAPAPVRNLVVRGLILPFRPKKSAEAYSNIWTDEGSPLLVTSRKQQELVQSQVQSDVYLAMRYGNPSIPDTVRKIAEDGVTDLYIIPLYPHYAMSSYETVVVAVKEALQQIAPEMRTTLMLPFYDDPAYIGALAESAEPYLQRPYDRLLFSFHGVPERHLRKSDPSHAHCLCSKDCCYDPNPAHATCYRHQCIRSVELFLEASGVPREKHFLSFQSRLGRDPWLQPYTDQTLVAMAREGVKRVFVMTPAFVADCLETLEEIAMEGKETFLEEGGEEFELIPCLNTHPSFIDFLVDKIEQWEAGPPKPEPREEKLGHVTYLAV